MKLKTWRRKANLSLQAVADLLGVHFTTVHKWERDERVPNAVWVAAIERLTRQKVSARDFGSGGKEV